ncbi:hypothetical protein T06_5596 [Trichinella sp. T6]|nr:hypothetical protein T06_5596 [Trichinella sp. T6]
MHQRSGEPLQLVRWKGRVPVMVVRNLAVLSVLGTNFCDWFVRTVDWQTREITMTDGSKVRIEHDPSRAGQPSIGCAVGAKPWSVASDSGAGTAWWPWWMEQSIPRGARWSYAAYSGNAGRSSRVAIPTLEERAL